MKNNNIDENVVRIIAAQVVLLSLIALQNQWIIIMLFLTIDFALRAFTNRVSPLAFLSKKIVQFLKLKPKPIFAAPKKFAAALGTFFSLSILILLSLELNLLAWIVGLTLIFCAVLESALKICVGCYVFNWLVLPFQNNFNKLIKKS